MTLIPSYINIFSFLWKMINKLIETRLLYSLQGKSSNMRQIVGGYQEAKDGHLFFPIIDLFDTKRYLLTFNFLWQFTWLIIHIIPEKSKLFVFGRCNVQWYLFIVQGWWTHIFWFKRKQEFDNKCEVFYHCDTKHKFP